MYARYWGCIFKGHKKESKVAVPNCGSCASVNPWRLSKAATASSVQNGPRCHGFHAIRKAKKDNFLLKLLGIILTVVAQCCTLP